MPSTLNEFLENALKDRPVVNEIVSPQMHKKLKTLQTEITAIRNQMRMDGYDKQADQIYMKFSDVLREINKVYK
jgi:hypothetical protein